MIILVLYAALGIGQVGQATSLVCPHDRDRFLACLYAAIDGQMRIQWASVLRHKRGMALKTA